MAHEAPLREKADYGLPEERDGRWEVVERVCNSAALKRSAKLRALLLYLCHRWWTEGATEVREHEIGVDVFERPADYDSTQDTLVRVQASQLRKRLERYFAEEGRAEPLILEISKGGYEPVFRDREAEAVAGPAEVVEVRVAAAGPSSLSAAPPVLPVRTARKAVWVPAGLCVVLSGLCGWLWVRGGSAGLRTSDGGARLQEFWSQFSPAGEETTVVIADGAFSALQDMLQRPIGLDEYVSRGYREELNRPRHSAEKKDVLGYLMERRYTSLADVMLVKRLWTVGVLDPGTTSVMYSRDLHLRSFQKGNHVLVGSRRAVPWVDLFDEAMDFHYVYDEATRTVKVQNRRPKAGEPVSFAIPAGSADRFSVVASLPNLAKTGNVLILCGQEISGTEAAANMVTTDRLLGAVLDRLPASARSSGGVPRFEVLLRVKHVEYTTQGYDILAVHVH